MEKENKFEEWKKQKKRKMREINITKDRKEVARIIEFNLALMNMNKKMCENVADCIIAYLMGALE